MQLLQGRSEDSEGLKHQRTTSEVLFKSRRAATVKPSLSEPDRLDISPSGPFSHLQRTAESNTLSCCGVRKSAALSNPREVVKRHFRVSINSCSLKKGTHIWVDYSKSFRTRKTLSDASCRSHTNICRSCVIRLKARKRLCFSQKN